MTNRHEPLSLAEMQAKNPEYDFWTYLYDCSQRLETDPEGSHELVLGTIIEVFDRTFDPVDQYPEYTVVALCKSLLKNKLTENKSLRDDENANRP